ncbi:MAG: CCA tRNA nucleotidyltransferase [Chloroflexi bacterium]|nr:CCA tRNA nucleotidyltransferase [Chloroflexota bacterium]MCI0831398.1 CCA tRNA nucleotidyltransferase [Chloroflexota bacterium]MCI0882898.1 CCA tRNA nucleotidyltransferase [Chloroflexota bacterium]
MPGSPKLIDKLLASLPKEQVNALSRLIELANQRGTAIYLVGGPVRDLLLDLLPGDLDVAVEGDAIDLATHLAAAADLRIVRHARFGTATVSGDGAHIDLATARSETYEAAGALPTVHPSSIDDDLHRRDFTVNAMAFALNGNAVGRLLDPAGGRANLDAGLIRVLHDASFQDDATRILRAARYEARLGFRIEEATHDLLVRDLPFLETISSARVHRELARTLLEREPERALLRLADLGALRTLHPSLHFDSELGAAFGRLREIGPRAVLTAYWPLVTWQVAQPAIERVITRLALTRRQADAARALRELRGNAPRPGASPSETASIFAAQPAAAVWALAAAASGAVREQAHAYMVTYRSVHPLLRGDDLPALGVPPGKAVGEVLARLRAAKLDGEVRTRADEERLVRSLARNNE